MTPYKILFPIETASRELLYKLALASRFAAMGHECYVGSKREIYRLFSHVSPFIYFDKGYHPEVSEAIYREINRYSGLIVNLDEEGGVDFKHCRTIAARYPNEIFKSCDLVFLWGKSQYKFLKSKRNDFDDKKVVISGHPRFELLKPEFHWLYKSEVARIKKRFGDYILVSTNMGFGNNVRGRQFVRENYGERITNIEEIIEFDEEKLEKIVSFVIKLSEKTTCPIIVRPHPEENNQIYKQSFEEFNNVHVVYEGSVVPWIIGAELMIHPDCTTGIESRMIGKMPISLLPKGGDDLQTHGTVELSSQFEDVDELVEFIIEKKYLSGENVEHSILHNFFSYYADSQNIIVTEIDKLISTINSQDVKNFNYLNSLKFFVSSLVSNGFHSLSKGELYLLQRNKLRGFDKPYVNKVVNCINKNCPGEVKVCSKAINQYLFRISQ